MTEGLEELDGETPVAYLVGALAEKAAGRPVNEKAIQFAVALVSVATLMNKGIDMDTAIAVTESAMDSGDIRVSWSSEDGLEVEFGESIVAETKEEQS